MWHLLVILKHGFSAYQGKTLLSLHAFVKAAIIVFVRKCFLRFSRVISYCFCFSASTGISSLKKKGQYFQQFMSTMRYCPQHSGQSQSPSSIQRRSPICWLHLLQGIIVKRFKKSEGYYLLKSMLKSNYL